MDNGLVVQRNERAPGKIILHLYPSQTVKIFHILVSLSMWNTPPPPGTEGIKLDVNNCKNSFD